MDEIKPISRVDRRLIFKGADIIENPPEDITYQHTVLCQTCLPYRDPGNDVLEWEKEQGAVALRIEATKVRDPDTEKWINLGLPFGPKPRLILMHLKPTVCLDVISLVASSCEYNRSQIEQCVAH